ncbi:hypothetical protein [Flavobacterium sp. TAB 87]|uniref:hypothetical protein n=1 Tax=Flavobacterium sp. TAB 87 TaxID=1729581 RepID=UPI00076C81A4|nr:hypothetical protein [Flavobacterium sp. TAB 87]KVV16206.1 hypothetical protein AP058_00264 [Flavobacterium sp. TAB 87]
MKRCFLIVLSALLVQSSYGQAKQRKELLLQIIALKGYMEQARTGYSAVKKGLDFVGTVKRGEFGLHTAYYLGLDKVNPKIKNSLQVASIISLQIKMTKLQSKTRIKLSRTDLFHGNEIDYIERSFEKMLDNSWQTLESLLTLTTDFDLSLTDDERLHRIELLFKSMRADYGFCQAFSSQISKLALARSKELNDTKTVRLWHGLDQ